MLIIKKYRCEFCGEIFENASTCHKHELKHLGLKEYLYKKWKKIRRNLVYSAELLSEINNKENLDYFLMRKQELDQFEDEHNLRGKVIPQNIQEKESD